MTLSPPTVALRDLLQRNAFRVLGLPGEASWSEIVESSEHLRSRSWTRHRSSWDLPWLGPVRREAGDVDAALARLSEPDLRLLDRMFWFHDRDAEAAVGDLTPGSIRNAIEGWSSTSLPVARHDAAIVALIAASSLDIGLDDIALWQRTVREWTQLIENEGYWLAFMKAELAGGFERLASLGDVRDLRESALGCVTDLVVSGARDALIGGKPGHAIRAVEMLRSEVPPQVFDEMCGDLARVLGVGAPAPRREPESRAPEPAPHTPSDDSTPWWVSLGDHRKPEAAPLVPPQIDAQAAPEPVIEATRATQNPPAFEAMIQPIGEAVPESKVEPVLDAASLDHAVDVNDAPATAPKIEAAVEHVHDLSVDLNVEPAAVPSIEAAVEPVAEPAIEAAVEPVAEPAIAPTVESMFDTAGETVVEPKMDTLAAPWMRRSTPVEQPHARPQAPWVWHPRSADSIPTPQPDVSRWGEPDAVTAPELPTAAEAPAAFQAEADTAPTIEPSHVKPISVEEPLRFDMSSVTDAPHVEPTWMIEPSRVDTPSAETWRATTPRPEAPSAEAPSEEAPSEEAPSVEAPRVKILTASEPAPVEPPSIDTPRVELPRVAEPIVVEKPAVVEKPTVEAPIAEAPLVEAPATSAVTATPPKTTPAAPFAPIQREWKSPAPEREKPTPPRWEKPAAPLGSMPAAGRSEQKTSAKAPSADSRVSIEPRVAPPATQSAVHVAENVASDEPSPPAAIWPRRTKSRRLVARALAARGAAASSGPSILQKTGIGLLSVGIGLLPFVLLVLFSNATDETRETVSGTPEASAWVLESRIELNEEAIGKLLVERAEHDRVRSSLERDLAETRSLLADYQRRIDQGLPHDPLAYLRLQRYHDATQTKYEQAVRERSELTERYEARLLRRERLAAQQNQIAAR